MYSIQSKAMFQELVLEQEGLVALACWAAWCGPCRKFAPIFTELAEELTSDKLSFVKLNIVDYSELAQEIGVYEIPSIYLYKDGEVVEEMAGIKSLAEYKQLILAHQ